MNKECLRCKTVMKEVNQANAPSLVIDKKEDNFKSTFEKRSGVNIFVCPKCGYLEFIAKKPEIFNWIKSYHLYYASLNNL